MQVIDDDAYYEALLRDGWRRCAMGQLITQHCAEAERQRRQSDALFSAGARLALELECLLLETRDTAAVSKWWDSAHEALEMWRDALRGLEREPVSNADEFSRAIRLADDAAESVICTEGRIEAPGVWRITREVFDDDRAYLSDCIEHLRWRGMADVETDAATGDVVVGFRGK
ncbi:MAG: hypothetical protein N2690_07105 [Rhodocyclaceae bacterium]|nr:hypothetical protein [Rhodocyclaceae bacterium]